jgi:hypothetical protein
MQLRGYIHNSLMVRHLLTSIAECFDILDTFDKENFFNHQRGLWMFYPHKGNVRVAADTWRRFADIWAEGHIHMRAWCANYLVEGRDNIYVRYHIELGSAHLLARLESYRQPVTIVPEVATFDGWTEAVRIVDEAVAQLPFDRCNDPAILAIHEGQECNNNGFFCFICEDQELKWTYKIRDSVKTTINVFLNKNAPCPHLLAPSNWSGPPRPIPEPIEYTPLSGKTAFQAMKALLDATMSLRFALRVKSYAKSDYDIFILLWSVIYAVDAALPHLIERVTEIEALL